MVKIVNSISEIEKSHWDKLNKNKNPFTSYAFLKALETSKCIGFNTGWDPRYFVTTDSIAFVFVKLHSYGEYTFDWQWANAYEQHGLSYYPKIVSMSPFSPVTVDHFLGELSSKVLEAIESFYNDYNFSSSHFLYLNNKDKEILKENGYIPRTNIQYHFYNNKYKDFNNFLDELKSKKRKQLIKERSFPNEIKISKYTKSDLNEQMAKRMYQFYLQTIQEKGSIPYLNEVFFIEVFSKLKEQVLYVEASLNENPIAASLFFYNETKIFGRYWGCTENIKNLHFELCYYQGIEFCIKEGLEIFEAGAQGEHKIKRGFKPVAIHSAHNFKNSSFKQAIVNYIDEESRMHYNSIKFLSQQLPFKSDQESLKKD